MDDDEMADPPVSEVAHLIDQVAATLADLLVIVTQIGADAHAIRVAVEGGPE